jgi:RNA polymerase sigma factor (sigma-70 family)
MPDMYGREHPYGKEVSGMTVAGADRERRFRCLFARYLPDMVAYCGWRTESAADAQDAVSEVFLTVWRRLDDVPEGDDARLWIYATARRVLSNQARAQRRRALLTTRLGSLAERYGEAGEHLVAPALQEDGLDPLEAQLVRAALAQLRPLDQEILLLSEWEGLEPAQIAQVLHCPAVTARGRLFRARRRFREAYELAERPDGRKAPPMCGRESVIHSDSARGHAADRPLSEAGVMISR